MSLKRTFIKFSKDNVHCVFVNNIKLIEHSQIGSHFTLIKRKKNTHEKKQMGRVIKICVSDSVNTSRRTTTPPKRRLIP